MHNYFSISNLSEYFYCPRSFIYLQSNFRLCQEENYFIVDGRKKHFKSSEQKEFFNRRGEKIFTQVFVFSKEKQILGKIDRLEIVDKNNVRIIEEKRGKLRTDLKIEWQVKFLSYAYSEMYPDMTIKASIYFVDSRRHKVIDINKKEISEKIDNLKNKIINKGYFEAKRGARCNGCMYHRICG